MSRPAVPSGLGSYGAIFRPELNVMERIGALRGLADAYARLHPQLQELDRRAQGPALEARVWVVIGRHEARGRVEPAQVWFDAVEALEKHRVECEATTHRSNFERPAAYTDLLDEVAATGVRSAPTRSISA